MPQATPSVLGKIIRLSIKILDEKDKKFRGELFASVFGVAIVSVFEF